jgi:hypothetical protein
MSQSTYLEGTCHTACILEDATPLATVYLQHTECYNCMWTTNSLHGSTTEPRAEKRYQTQLAYGLQGWHRGKAASRAEKK